MFISVRRYSDDEHVIIRRDAIRFIEPALNGMAVMLHVDGIGVVITQTYDITGFASNVSETELEEAA